jgi:hypothetical protein
MTNTSDTAPIPSLPPLTMPIEEAIRTQRALRRLRPDPVDDALVLRWPWRVTPGAVVPPVQDPSALKVPYDVRRERAGYTAIHAVAGAHLQSRP